jgi:hypothetical protein
MLVKLSEPVTSVDAEEDILSNREANFIQEGEHRKRMER